MSDFIVSARKYRPDTFDSVVGQKHITSTLRNAIQNNQLAQAFLFCGPRGVGKTTCARILAKTINCENITPQVEACGECGSCQSFQQGASMSIHELDAASNNSVEDIRTLIEQVRIPPQTGKYKIYIIDEVHMLTTAAFNAFLKTLEEPPSYAIFILATTEKHKILPTILSRCQIFDFNRIKVEDMAEHLESIAQKEQIQYEKDGLYMIAQKADGGLRDALSMFDQIVSFSDKNVSYQAVVDNLNVLDYDYYFKITDCIKEENVPDTLLIFDQILGGGFEGNHYISGLASHFRNLLISKEPKTVQLLEVSDNIKKRYLEQSSALSTGLLLSALNIANHCEVNYRTSNNKRLQVELALMKMCHIATAISLASQPLATPSEGVKKKESPKGELKTEGKGESTVSSPSIKKEVGAGVKAEKYQKTDKKESISVPSLAQKEEAPKASVQDSAPKKPAWGKAASSISIPSITSVLEEKEADEEAELIEGDLQEEVSFTDFIKAWKTFAEKLRAENRITLYTIMTADKPILENNKIKVGVENKIQEQELRDGKIDVLNFLRVELKNYALELEEVLVEQKRIRKPYTSKEKYQAMVAKNPKLDLLRQKFDLGLS